MKNLINTVLETTKERIKNPFIGTLFLAWIVINWKPILILLFSSKSIHEKIGEITLNHSKPWDNYFMPFIIALIYVIILPYFMWFVEMLINKANKERKAIVNIQVVEDTIGKQAIIKEELNLEEIKAKYVDKADLNKQIEKLTTSLEERDNKIKLLDDELTFFKDNSKGKDSSLTEEEQKRFTENYIEFIKTDLYPYFEKLGTEVSQRKRIPDHIKDLVVEKYLLNEIINKFEDETNERVYYDFSRKGQYFWQQFVMSKPIEPVEEFNYDI